MNMLPLQAAEEIQETVQSHPTYEDGTRKQGSKTALPHLQVNVFKRCKHESALLSDAYW